MRRIDGKYHIDIAPAVHAASCKFPQLECACGAKPRPVIVNTATGAILPEDEPLILFRAKDKLLVPLLDQYRQMCERQCSPAHIAGIAAEQRKVRAFALEHPERLKTPD